MSTDTDRRLFELSKKVDRMSTPDVPRTMGDVFGAFMMANGLRGFWPFSSTDQNLNPIDASGQARTLTNNGTIVYGTIGNIPYGIFNGSSQWLSRADEAGLDITANLTFGAWMYANTNGTLYMPMGKFGASGNYSYCIQRLAANQYQANISGNGTAQFAAVFPTVSTPAKWEFIVARYTPSTELAIFMNGVKFVNTTTVPASVFSGNGNFAIGRWDGGTAQYFPGRVALPFLCAAALPDDVIQTMYRITRVFFGV